MYESAADYLRMCRTCLLISRYGSRHEAYTLRMPFIRSISHLLAGSFLICTLITAQLARRGCQENDKNQTKATCPATRAIIFAGSPISYLLAATSSARATTPSLRSAAQ